jgi:hypothetical protein
MAATVGRRATDRLKRQVEEEARRRAPGAKMWVTEQDERVRPSHQDADKQTIPDNLRFQLPKVANTRRGEWRRIPGFDLARFPRDPGLPVHQTVRCRCVAVALPEALAVSIHAGATEIQGAQARAEVATRFNRAAEAEHGTSHDTGGHFMSGAVRAVAARLR